jgi:5-deoxy-glucuronate isomerase
MQARGLPLSKFWRRSGASEMTSASLMRTAGVEPRVIYAGYHRLNPGDGFGIQRVYTDDRTLDETMADRDGDVVLVPRGHHPCGAPYGFEMYYLNVMAGPLRKWRFVPAPEVEWILKRDA